MINTQVVAAKDVEIIGLNTRIVELERQLIEATGILHQIETAYVTGARNRSA